MAAVFSTASSRRIINSASPITEPPFTVGMWVKSTTADATRLIWAIGDTATSVNILRFGQIAGASQWLLSAVDSGGSTNTPIGAVVANAWSYIVARFISTTNRRMSILNPNGSADHGQSTVSRSPVGIDTMAIGIQETLTPGGAFDGAVAEFWYTNTDIQIDGAQLQDAMLRQLAYGGPLSVQHIAKDIVEYRSLRVHPEGDQIGEVFHGKAGRQSWSNVNGVTTGANPPLPHWYRRPSDAVRLLTV